MDILLRPDDIVHDDTAPTQAEVVAKAFRGAEFLYTLKLLSGAQVLSLVPSHHNHAIGEKIGIRLDVDHVVAFPRPHDSLARTRRQRFRRLRRHCANPTDCWPPAPISHRSGWLNAYRRGIFPWFSRGEPILWWSPDPRMVLFPAELKISRSLGKTLKNADYTVKLDTAFAQVIAACATTPRQGQSGTWIIPEMQLAYLRLHELGFAHSVETWHDDKLVGGLYGIAIGGAFFGESMFSHATDASKIALAHLCNHLICPQIRHN